MSFVLSANNFGPVAEGTVALTPVTVFTGANNTGKSFFAAFAYAATAGGGGLGYPDMYAGAVGLPHDETIIERSVSKRFTQEAQKLIDRFGPDGSQRVAPVSRVVTDLVAEAVSQALGVYAARVQQELERCFGGPLHAVAVGDDKRTATLSVSDADYGWEIALEILNNKATSAAPRELPDAGRLAATVAKQLATDSAREGMLRFTRDALRFAVYSGYSRGMTERPLDPGFVLIVACIRECFKSLPGARYYLPAARSGIMQSHRALATGVISRAQFAGLQDMDVPKLPGVVADFLIQLLNMPLGRTSQLDSVAKYLESEVLDGHIELRSNKAGYPAISYQRRRRRHPLDRTSSMISELAPVVLYLRYLLDPHELLIVEEPESHLHPSSQRRFARAIARIVSAKADVILTTHSDYFLGEINNLIRAHSLPSGKGDNLRIPKSERLSPTKVSAYLFAQRPMAGSIVKRVEVSEEEGITEAGLGEVAEELYDETVALQRAFE